MNEPSNHLHIYIETLSTTSPPRQSLTKDHTPTQQIFSYFNSTKSTNVQSLILSQKQNWISKTISPNSRIISLIPLPRHENNSNNLRDVFFLSQLTFVTTFNRQLQNLIITRGVHLVSMQIILSAFHARAKRWANLQRECFFPDQSSLSESSQGDSNNSFRLIFCLIHVICETTVPFLISVAS